MSKRYFLIEDSIFAEYEVGPQIVMGAVQQPPSYAFMCPHCGKIWARAFIEGQEFFAVTAHCRQHWEKCWDVAGSLIPGLRDEWKLVNLPRALLEWEFARHYEHYERSLK